MNFAMPSNIIKTITKKLENNENINNIKLGVWIYDKHSIKESEYNIDLNTGVYVATVDNNSIGEISGIKPGDIILSIDGKQVDNVLDFKQKLYEESSKKEIILEVKRDNKVHLIKINA
jgi:serine protease Do